MFIDFFSPSRRERPIPPRMAFLAMARTGPECEVIRVTSSLTVASSLASGTRRDQAEFERALGSNRFAGQNDFEGALWPDQERQDRGGQGREHADGDFGLREAGFRRGYDEIAEGG